MGTRKLGRGRNPQFIAPDIPEEQWCEARKLYESGMTLSQIGQQLQCDPRTVRSCILKNRDQLDTKNISRIMKSYEDFVRQLFYSGELIGIRNLGKVSQRIYKLLKERTDYSSSEKTVRLFLDELLLETLTTHSNGIMQNPEWILEQDGESLQHTG